MVNEVNTIETAAIFSSESKPMTSMRVTAAPNHQYTKAPLTIASNSLTKTRAFLKRSSHNPPKNTGMAQANNTSKSRKISGSRS